MTMRAITMTLPEQLYARLAAQAQAAAQSLDDVIAQTLERNLPAPVESDLPTALQAELRAMDRLSDEALWSIAQSTMNVDKVALYDVLLERLHAGTLTPEGQEWLTQLREEADRLTLRKSHAYLLLQQRGHRLPALAELSVKP